VAFERIRLLIRRLVKQRHYYSTAHADEEMDNDEISIFDLERVLCEGDLIARQRDEKSGEWKYILNGLNFGLAVETVVKIASSQVVIITVYSLRAK